MTGERGWERGPPPGHRPPRTSSAGRATCRCERVTWASAPRHVTRHACQRVALGSGSSSESGPAQVTSVTVTPAAAREHETCTWGTCTRVRVALSVHNRRPAPRGRAVPSAERSPSGVARAPAATENAGLVHGDVGTCRGFPLPLRVWLPLTAPRVRVCAGKRYASL